MAPKEIAPEIDLTAFSCPHCGALAHQHWYQTYARRRDKDSTPFIIRETNKESFLKDLPKDDESASAARNFVSKMAEGVPFMDDSARSEYVRDVNNMSISTCFNCNKLSLWVFDRLLWPAAIASPAPNPDLPDDIRVDYEEAGRVLDVSPRGAAALLRLCVQKLCLHLGQSGENLNRDIAALVRDGLDVRIQQALDIVRVIGNNAVHPGQIDLKDDRTTASQLFQLVNLIADATISQPKHVNAMFSALPTGAKEQIAKRDQQQKP